MRVLQLISSGGMYGAEAVILNLARCLDASGHHSVLGVFANTAGGDVQLHREALASNLESHLLPCAGQFDRRMMAQLRHFVREHHIDVVHTHGYKADVYAFLALRRAGIPIVATCHNWLDTDAKVRAYGIMDRFVLRRFHSIAAVSEAVQTTLVRSGVPREKVHIIQNGIDPKPFQQVAGNAPPSRESHEPLRVGLIGRLTREKGIDLFLRAADIVLKQQPNVNFIIAGDGPDRESLDHLVRDLGIASNVTLLGRCNDIPGLLASLDLVVSASRFEGLPMSILETMASSRAIIATDVGDVSKVLNGGKAGLLIPPEDTGALGTAILLLLNDSGLRHRYAALGLAQVLSHFSADRMTQGYLGLYTAAILSRAALQPINSSR